MRYKKGGSPAGLKIRRNGAISGNKVKLRRKKLSDARNDYVWQSDPELARLDAAPALSLSFPLYLLNYAEHLHDAGLDRYPFAVETLEGKHIGNCTCYDIDNDKDEAQLGIMIGDRDYWDKGYGADAVITLVNHLFLNTGLKRIYLKTLDWNLRAQKCFRNCGFIPCGEFDWDGHKFVVMEFQRKHWLEPRDRGEADKDG